LAYGQKTIEKIDFLCQADILDITVNSPGGLESPAASVETGMREKNG